jgi:TadE-like protein
VIEAVLIIPAVMIVLLAVVQFALWAHAAQVVQLAASEGDRSARAFGGGTVAGSSAAHSILQEAGSDLASSLVSVDVMPGDMARVQVQGTAVAVLPGLSLPVSATQVGPIQEFRSSE